MLWKPRPGGVACAAEFTKARSLIREIHRLEEWNPWVREDRLANTRPPSRSSGSGPAPRDPDPGGLDPRHLGPRRRHYQGRAAPDAVPHRRSSAFLEADDRASRTSQPQSRTKMR
jgi:hypothetical protein